MRVGLIRRASTGSATAILRHVAPYRRSVLYLSTTATVGGLAEAATLVALAALATAVAGRQDVVTIPVAGVVVTISVTALGGLAILALSVRAVSQIVASWINVSISSRYEAEQRARLVLNYQDAHWRVQSEEAAGSLQDVITSDVEMGRIGFDALGSGVAYLCGLGILVSASLTISPAVTAIILMTGLVISISARPLANQIQRLSSRRAEANSIWASEVNQAIVFAREIRIFDTEKRFASRVCEMVEAMTGVRRKVDFLAKMIPVIYQTAIFFVLIAGLVVVSRTTSTGMSSASAIALLLVRSASLAQGLQAVYNRLAEQLPFLDRVAAKIKELQEARETQDGIALSPVRSLELRDVGFAYSESGRVLDDVSLSINRGEVIGIVGPSGSGKSTLAQLVLRLRYPTEGEFFVNGRAANEFSSESWYRRFSFVPQEPVLLEHSLEENIRFGRSQVTEEDVIVAAKLAHVWDEIGRLPDGLATVMGTRGGRLSGGQRQRVCIARALAGKPDLIVFDEPTSALDVESERSIRRTMQSLKGSVTLIIIAHRLSTLDICDRIVVLDSGRICASGSRVELEQEGGYYSRAIRLAGLQ